MKLSMKKSIILLFVLTSLIPIIGIGMYTLSASEKEILEGVKTENSIFLEMTKEGFNSKFEAKRVLVEFLSTNEAFIKTLELKGIIETSEEIDDQQDLKSDYNNYYFMAQKIINDVVKDKDLSGAFFTDRNGIVVYHTTESAIGADISSREYIQSSFKGLTNYNDMFLSDITNTVTLLISTPIKHNGLIVGTVNLIFDIDQIIDASLHDGLIHLGETADAYLIDANGLLQSNTKYGDYSENGILKGTISSDVVTTLAPAIEGHLFDFSTTSRYENYEGNKVFGSSTVVELGEQPAGLVIEVSEKEVLSHLHQLRLIIYGAIAIVLALGFVTAFFIIRSILKPINEISNSAKSVSLGNTDVDLTKPLKRKDEIGQLAKAFKQVIDSNKLKASMIEDIATGNLTTNFENMPQEDLVFKNIQTVMDNLRLFSSRIQDSSLMISAGHFNEHINSVGLNGIYKDLIGDVNRLVTGFSEKFDTLGTPLYIIDTDLRIVYFNQAFETIIGRSLADMAGEPYYKYLGNPNARPQENAGYQAIKTKKAVSGQASITLQGQNYHFQYNVLPMIENGKVTGAFTTLGDLTEVTNNQQTLEKQSKYQSKYVQNLLENISILEKGQFDLNFIDLPYDDSTEEIYILFKTINNRLETAVTSINSYVHEISHVLTNLSKSNLNVSVTRDYVGEFESIKIALNTIINSFNDVIHNIYLTSEEVTTGAKQMSESSQSLSSGATEQAASIEEISATVTQVAAQVQENAKHASLVNLRAQEAQSTAHQSNQQMEMLTTSMKDIQQSSSNIQKVLKMINDIAFQTNILSLNAAVEAARAGQHGRGFAVIAEDVRSLALKSASAADETSDMLDTIVRKINDTVSFAADTASSLQNIVDGAKESVQVSSEVAVASSEQATAISQINTSLDQISQVVQTTSVNAQQGASTSNHLTHLATNLLDVVTKFNLKNVKLEKTVENPTIKTKDLYQDELIINLDDDLSF